MLLLIGCLINNLIDETKPKGGAFKFFFVDQSRLNPNDLNNFKFSYC